MPTISLTIPHPPVSYDVTVGSGLLAIAGQTLRQFSRSPRCCVVTDRHVAAHHLEPLQHSLQGAGFTVTTHIFEPGEKHKTLAAVSAGLDVFLQAGVERSTPVIALGGGVVGDMGGLIAALLLRGVPFIQMPTTLLAAVDASVGGKVGVDHAVGKNLIGAFHQPTAVLADVDTLATLPAREMRCGLAECVKHAIIRDHALFGFIGANVGKLLAGDRESLTELIAWNVRIKARVVQEDPHEQGVRALLNLGHTFGHAIETVTHYGTIQHGEAVALGLVAAARLGQRRGHLSAHDVTQITDLIDFLELPTAVPELPIDATLHAMNADKKVRAGKRRFIVPTRIGDATIIDDTTDEEVRAVLRTLCDAPEACE